MCCVTVLTAPAQSHARPRQAEQRPRGGLGDPDLHELPLSTLAGGMAVIGVAAEPNNVPAVDPQGGDQRIDVQADFGDPTANDIETGVKRRV